MAIQRIGSDLVPPPTPKEVSGAEDVTDDESTDALSSGGGQRDRVELSKQGLARAAELSEEAGTALAAERGTEIRTRIAAAFYDAPSVASEVARRLIDSGDLLGDPSTPT